MLRSRRRWVNAYSFVLCCQLAGCSDTERHPLLDPVELGGHGGDAGASQGGSSSESGDETSTMSATGGPEATGANGGSGGSWPGAGAGTPTAGTAGGVGGTSNQGETSTGHDSGGSGGHDDHDNNGGAAGAQPESATTGSEGGGGVTCPLRQGTLPVSTCATIDGGRFPYITFGGASDVASTGLTVFATQATEHIAAVTWQPKAGSGQDFVSWGCFDYVPFVRRVAAHMHPRGTEVLASTLDGKLYQRTSFNGPWTDWAPVAGPTEDSCVLDVATPQTSDGDNHRFVNDLGVVFEAHVADDSFGSFSSWQRVGAVGGSRIDAVSLEGWKCVLALDAEGRPQLAHQLEQKIDSAFSEFGPLGRGAPKLQGIAAVALPTAEVQAFGVDSAGTLWRLSSLADHGQRDWEPVDESSGDQRIVDVSTATLRDDTVAVLGVTAGGSVLRRTPTSDGLWQPLAL